MHIQSPVDSTWDNRPHKTENPWHCYVSVDNKRWKIIPVIPLYMCSNTQIIWNNVLYY